MVGGVGAIGTFWGGGEVAEKAGNYEERETRFICCLIQWKNRLQSCFYSLLYSFLNATSHG